MRQARWLPLLLAAIACGDNNSSLGPPLPDPEAPPEITSAFPTADRIDMRVGDVVTFEVTASDPNDDLMFFAFWVNGVSVTKHSRMTYRPQRTGAVVVLATVSDGSHEASRHWTVLVTEEPPPPDVTPPAVVTITRFEATTVGGSADLEWATVGDDGNEGRAQRYRVRTSPAPVVTESDWLNAELYGEYVYDLPVGSSVHVTLAGLEAGEQIYVNVRALDDADNLSPPSNSPGVRLPGDDLFGIVLDPYTGRPLDGISVFYGTLTGVTDADGRFEMRDFARQFATLSVRDELGEGDVGNYFDCEFAHNSAPSETITLYLMPVLPLGSQLYANFLVFYQSLTTTAGTPNGTRTLRWELPIDLNIEPYSRDGLDYQAAILEVAAEFDALMGQPVFRIVDTAPNVGVRVHYVDDLLRDNYRVNAWTVEGYPLRGEVQHRTTYTPASAGALRRVVRHELGHVLGLNHSADDTHVMAGGSAPTAEAFAPEEVAVMRCFYAIARGFDSRWFIQQ